MIISDVHLENGGSVFDFLKWVKSRSELKTIPFVLLSLQATEQAKYLADAVRTTARTFGAAKYINMEILNPISLSKEISELLPASTSIITYEGR